MSCFFLLTATSIFFDMKISRKGLVVTRVCLGDYGNSRRRCQVCTSCNEKSNFTSNLTCGCKDWHAGRASDIRQCANLLYRLLVSPKHHNAIDHLGTEGLIKIINEKVINYIVGQYIVYINRKSMEVYTS
jgi:hypothetical protein